MSASKLKTIIIAILLATNLFLLALVIPARRAAAEREASVRASLATLYAGYGVTLDTDLPTAEQPLLPLVLEADTQAQSEAARALLGADAEPEPDEAGQRGGYRGAGGECRFSHGGAFSAALTQQRLDGDDLPRACARVLEKAGFVCDGAPAAERMSAGVYELRATQQVSGAPVFSAQVTASCANGALTTLSGTFLTGTAQPAPDASGGIACADALIAFLGSRDSLGWVGSRVVSVRQGYVLTETASATTVRLSPVWRVETDTGAFYVDGATGAVSAAS